MGPGLLVARVPLLPVETVVDVYERAGSADDVARFRSPLVDLAVHLASPELLRALNQPGSAAGKKHERSSKKLLAYLSRMAYRATPFGIFAGVGLVEVAGATSLAIDDGARAIRSRSDASWLLGSLRREIGASWETLARLRVRLSDQLLEQGGRLYTLRQESPDDTANLTPTASLRVTHTIDAVRERTREWIAFGELVAQLERETRIRDPRALVTTLWGAGLFIDELTISPIGADPVAEVMAVLDRILPQKAGELRAHVERLRQLDVKFGLGTLTADDVAAAADAARAYDPAAPAFQVDMVHRFSGTLGARVGVEVRRYAELIVRSSYVPVMTGLHDGFRAMFEGERRLVPLLEFADAVLDLGPEAWKMPLTDPRDGPEPSRVLASIMAESIRTGSIEVELSSADMAVLYAPLDDAVRGFTPTFEVGFQVAARSAEDIDRGRFTIWPAGFHASARGGASTARFADLLGCAPKRSFGEQRPGGGITAELVFAPVVVRHYNVMIRPPSVHHELQLGLHAENDGCRRISPEDLCVGLEDGRLFLWSRSLGARVNPVETHMFNTRNMAPFLARLVKAIASDGIGLPQTFDWGTFAAAPFLPRVRAGRIVLSRARWRFIPPPKCDEAAWTHALLRFASEWRMPRYVSLSQGENRLLIDLASPLALALARAEAKDVTAIFEEVVQPEDHWLSGERGHYAAEFVSSFALELPPVPRTVAAPLVPGSLPRTAPVDAWMYVQLFCSAHRVETLLRVYVAPLIEALRAPGQPLTYFFVRYRTSESHLRLRISLEDPDRALLLSRALDEWARGGVIRKWAVCAYERELERYGGAEGLAAAERVFTVSSDIALDAVASRTTDDRNATMRHARHFLAALAQAALEPAELRAWLERTRPGGPYRKLADWQREALARPDGAEAGLRDDIASRIREPAQALRRLVTGGRLAAPLFEVQLALGHMHCNRLGLDHDGEARARVLLWHEFYRETARKSLV